jgi:hypothetical protein
VGQTPTSAQTGECRYAHRLLKALGKDGEGKAGYPATISLLCVTYARAKYLKVSV